jgi:hypothetical protein
MRSSFVASIHVLEFQIAQKDSNFYLIKVATSATNEGNKNERARF